MLRSVVPPLLFLISALGVHAQGTPTVAQPPPPATPAATIGGAAKPATQTTPAPAAPGAPLPTPEPVPPEDTTRVAILGYHDFSETLKETEMRMKPSKFRNQMAALRQLGITVISLADFLAWKRGEKTLPEKCALITLDDGWRSVHSDAFPILREFGYPFTLYLYKNYIDGGGKALTTEMIKEMQSHGATLGSHSVSHPYPATIRAHQKKGAHAFDAFLRKEFGESKRFIESKFTGKINTYAYPGGFVTDEMPALADEFGYEALFTVLPGKISRDSDPKRLPRYMILGTYDRIFEIATTFREAGTATPEGTITGLVQTTPYPVTPEAGAVINSRLPLISVDFSTLENLNPASLTMQISGFGEVPAKFDPVTKQFAWQVNRRLRQPTCQITVNWLDTAGAKPATPLRWTFQLDRTAAYVPPSR
jgi:peptidoglycan/xylan/chitin deacetylase (PgdA/CDA1 family)